MISVIIRPISPEQTKKFKDARERILGALYREMLIQVGMLRRYIKEKKLSGQVLKNRTGNLRRAVQEEVTRHDTFIIGRVFVDRTAPYGAYQEYGAQIPERRPVRARALHWKSGGKDVFAMRAAAFTLKARPFMGPSLAERRDHIVNALKRAVTLELQK